MSAKGKERRREIREPFGRGIDKYREAEAIRQNPPRPDADAFQSMYRNARGPAGTSRHESTISVYGCAGEGSSAVKYRFLHVDAREYRLVFNNLILSLPRKSPLFPYAAHFQSVPRTVLLRHL